MEILDFKKGEEIEKRKHVVRFLENKRNIKISVKFMSFSALKVGRVRVWLRKEKVDENEERNGWIL